LVGFAVGTVGDAVGDVEFSHAAPQHEVPHWSLSMFRIASTS
jgi:hypothetical protein